MKRLFALLIVSMMLLGGCAAATVADEPADKALVTVDGETVMTVLDLTRLQKEQAVAKDFYEAEVIEEKELFLRSAERRVASYLAAKFYVGQSTASAEADYDSFADQMEDDPATYAADAAYTAALKAALGMDEAAFRSWSVAESIVAQSAENLIDDINKSYKSIIDPIELKERTQQNLDEFCAIYDIEIFYPGLEGRMGTFQYLE